MQTHKNPTLRQGPAPFKAPSASGGHNPAVVADKPPSFVRDGKKWLIVRYFSVFGLTVNNVTCF